MCLVPAVPGTVILLEGKMQLDNLIHASTLNDQCRMIYSFRSVIESFRH
jgi:hypothetical protein